MRSHDAKPLRSKLNEIYGADETITALDDQGVAELGENLRRRITAQLLKSETERHQRERQRTEDEAKRYTLEWQQKFEDYKKSCEKIVHDVQEDTKAQIARVQAGLGDRLRIAQLHHGKFDRFVSGITTYEWPEAIQKLITNPEEVNDALTAENYRAELLRYFQFCRQLGDSFQKENENIEKLSHDNGAR